VYGIYLVSLFRVFLGALAVAFPVSLVNITGVIDDFVDKSLGLNKKLF
jgi:hypothetical protein